MSYGFKIIVDGDYACFSRPEMKVERVSYDVPTISAIEGLLKSVYWKPPIEYVVDQIVVFNPIRFTNVRRNEVKNKLSYQSIRGQMNGNDTNPTIYTSEDRTQRGAMLLKDVRYGIAFHFNLTGQKSTHEGECQEKHYNIILRRLKNGQYFKTPVLGCREFPAKSIHLVDSFDLLQVSDELAGNVDLGYMLYKMAFRDKGIPVNKDWDNPKFSDVADAIFYRPHMIDGVINVADYKEDILC